MCLWGDRNLVNAHCEGTGIWWMLIDKVYFSLYIQILPVNDVLTAIVLCVILNWKFPYLFSFMQPYIVYQTQYGENHHFNMIFLVSQTILTKIVIVFFIFMNCVFVIVFTDVCIQFVDMMLEPILFLNLHVNHNFVWSFICTCTWLL